MLSVRKCIHFLIGGRDLAL